MFYLHQIRQTFFTTIRLFHLRSWTYPRFDSGDGEKAEVGFPALYWRVVMRRSIFELVEVVLDLVSPFIFGFVMGIGSHLLLLPE